MFAANFPEILVRRASRLKLDWKSHRKVRTGGNWLPGYRGPAAVERSLLADQNSARGEPRSTLMDSKAYLSKSSGGSQVTPLLGTSILAAHKFHSAGFVDAARSNF